MKCQKLAVNIVTISMRCNFGNCFVLAHVSLILCSYIDIRLFSSSISKDLFAGALDSSRLTWTVWRMAIGSASLDAVGRPPEQRRGLRLSALQHNNTTHGYMEDERRVPVSVSTSWRTQRCANAAPAHDPSQFRSQHPWRR